MNERIRELMVDASSGACYDGNEPVLSGTEIEKFAELIIRECAATMRESVYDNPSDDWEYGYNSGVYSSIDSIQEKFGIEE